MTVYTTNYFNNRHTPIAQGVLTKAYKKMNAVDTYNKLSSFYECGKCKLASKEHKEHMIENGMLDLVVKHIHLFEN